MHPSLTSYLATLADKRRSPHTLKAARQDLTRFVTWWELRYRRPFDPSLLLDSDLRDWRLERQQTDGAAPATINRALSTLRRYCAWAVAAGMMTENAAGDIGDVPTPALAPRGLPPRRSRRCCARLAQRKMRRSVCATRPRWRY